jgi:hypothetical protein
MGLSRKLFVRDPASDLSYPPTFPAIFTATTVMVFDHPCVPLADLGHINLLHFKQGASLDLKQPVKVTSIEPRSLVIAALFSIEASSFWEIFSSRSARDTCSLIIINMLSVPFLLAR